MLKPQIMKLYLVFILTPELQNGIHNGLNFFLQPQFVLSQPTKSGKYENVCSLLMSFVVQGGSTAQSLQSFPDKGLQVRSFKLGQTLKTTDFLVLNMIEVYYSSSYQNKIACGLWHILNISM